MSLDAQILSDQANSRSAYVEFAAYRFHEDPEFLSGLESILGSADEAARLSAEERAEKVGRAKAFYFSRQETDSTCYDMKGVEVTWDGYLRYSQSQETNSGSSNVASVVEAASQPPETRTDPAPEEQPPLSFQQLSEMIATGNLTDVPFNRLIPEAISDQRPSDPAMPARRKPWETVDTSSMADEMATRMPDEIANSLAAELVDKDADRRSETADRTADGMAGRVAEIARRMADELPDRMADEAEMAVATKLKSRPTPTTGAPLHLVAQPFNDNQTHFESLLYIANMERIRQRMSEDPELYPTLARANNGSRHRPLVIFDSDDEDDSPKPTPLTKAPTSNQHAPLQVDRSNAPSNASSQGSFIKTSPNAHIPSYPAPVRATPQLQMNAPTPIAVPIPGSSQPVATPEGGETFNLANIANDPLERRKTTDEAEKDLKDLLEQSIGGEDVEVDMEKAIVEGFSKDWKLLAHQVQGRAWLGERESGKKCGGILGDDMGLGKTTQIVSRIVDYKMKEDDDVKRKETKKYGKTTLVVCPASVVTQWEAEIKKMAPSLRVLAHHGASRSKDGARLAQFDVVMTSYQTLSAEWKNHDGISNKDDAPAKGKGKSKVVESDESEDSEDDFVAAAKRLKAKKVKAAPKKPAALFERPWLRVVLDEAHTIKGRTTQGAKACYALQAKYRWCLTGTPIQNSVEELFSLLHFLQVRPLNDWDTFKAQIANPIKAGRSAVPMKRLHVVLSAIMLRRTKTQVVNGKPILSLPDRTVNMVECEFDQDEQEFYNALVERTDLTLNKFAKSGLTNKFTSVLVLLLRLRQACCHPELCMKNVKNDLDAIEPKVKETDKDEGEEEADDLADLLGKMTVKESRCELCDDQLEPGVKSKYCPDCEVQVVVKARRKSLPSGDDLDVQTLPSSAKTRKLVEILEKIEEESDGQDKTIVFSQFTSFLDIVEKFLRKAGIKFVRYDGSMKLEERSAALEKFRNNPNSNVALISFKAGSTGLNLTAANHVVLLDLWWNPALEDQAFDRAHRFGQKKDVFIHKLVIPKTVEERIQELQNKKRELATAALTGDKLGKNSRLRMDELLQLFAHDAAE